VGIENWQRICGLIEEEMLSFWLLIVDDVLAGHNCDEKLPKVINHEVVLSDFAVIKLNIFKFVPKGTN